VKIATLLAQYLYNNHRLDLPGIGTFLLDSSDTSISENSKQKSVPPPPISFESKPELDDSPDLVAYISSQTGKMKALANADLGSHLQLAQQFLNISKPFIFEGIGTLIMRRPGEYEFEPIGTPPEKIRDNKIKNTPAASLKDTEESYDSFLAKPKAKMEWNRPVIALFIVAGIGLAVWAGYTISKKAPGNATAANTEIQLSLSDSLAQADTMVTTVQPPADTLPKNYKYVLEVANKQRALKRYNQLKTNLWDVHLETKDSVQYKLFILLPAQNADTTRVVDSLTMWLGRKVYLEH
jgi:hypothetical protein